MTVSNIPNTRTNSTPATTTGTATGAGTGAPTGTSRIPAGATTTLRDAAPQTTYASSLRASNSTDTATLNAPSDTESNAARNTTIEEFIGSELDDDPPRAPSPQPDEGQEGSAGTADLRPPSEDNTDEAIQPDIPHFFGEFFKEGASEGSQTSID